MNSLVVITDQKAVTTSLIIAEAFEKEHKNVLRDISRLGCSDEFGRLNFEPSSYLNDQNKPQPMYHITRDGFFLIAMGFTGKKAMEFKEKFIAAFNAMEQALIEGQGEHRRVDVNMRHTRGITNPHGLDVDFRLDLTKIVMHPTRENLAILERLTGIPMDDIIAAAPPQPQNQLSEVFASFYETCCTLDPTAEKILFSRVYAAFVAYSDAVSSRKFFTGRRRFSSILQAAGHDVLYSGGSAYAVNLRLTERS